MPGDFDTELMEVLAEAGEEFNGQMRQMGAVGSRFFRNLAGRLAEIGPEEMPTTLALVFMAGRLHAQRGYASPLAASELTSIDDDALWRLTEGDHDERPDA
jgi:hypothetical protein